MVYMPIEMFHLSPIEYEIIYMYIIPDFRDDFFTINILAIQEMIGWLCNKNTYSPASF